MKNKKDKFKNKIKDKDESNRHRKKNKQIKDLPIDPGLNPRLLVINRQIIKCRPH